jgi:signal peptidase I
VKAFINKINNNKVFKIIRKIFSVLITILLVLIFVVIVVQKVSNNQVNLGGYGIYTVATGSMDPEYKVRDLILASKKDVNNIAVGDDVVYIGKEGSVSGKTVVHRVIERFDNDGRVSFITKGINNGLSDPEIDGSQILGVVKTKLHVLSFCSHLINNVYGLILLVVIPFIIFIFIEGKHAIDNAYKE